MNLWRTDPVVTKNPFRFFLFSSRPHWRVALGATALAATANALSASTSYTFKLITEAATALPSDAAYHALLLAGFGTVGLLAGAKFLWRASGFLAARWSMNASATGRYALTSYVTLHSRGYFSDRFAGSLANKVSHGARGVRDMVELFLWEFLELIVMAGTSLVILFGTNAVISWIFVAWIVGVVVFNIVFAQKRVPYSVRSQKLETTLNGSTVDLLTNISAMQEYARRAFELKRIKRTMEERRVAGLRNWYFGEYIRTMNSVLLVVFGSIMVFVTVQFARSGVISVGDVVLVVAVIFRIEGLLQGLGSSINRFGETWGELEESLDEIVEPHEIRDHASAQPLRAPRGEIEFRDVTFRYGHETLFDHLSLTIRAGERIGLVGRSGAGKSTLMRVLLHHHDLHGGAILIDGHDIARVTQDSLRAAIAVVPQEPLLFHRTIHENILYGNTDASVEQVREAANLAHAHEFIMRLPEQYESLVGERGVKLSGGERQRIAIARAILKDAPILLMDEATSALDSESEVAIQGALAKLMEKKTVIAIAHRLSTLRQMDRIIVLDQGKVIEEGTHQELTARGGVYAELWAHQAGGFLQDEE